MLYLLGRLLALPTILVSLVLSGSLAARLLGCALPTLFASDSERWRTVHQRLVLGCALAVSAMFLCAVVGLYRPLPLIVLTVLVALFGGAAVLGEREFERLLSVDSNTKARAIIDPTDGLEASSRSGREEESERKERGGRWSRIAQVERIAFTLTAAAFGVVLAVLWLQSLRPDLSWDANVYHLSLPKQFLKHGGFFAVPLSVYSHWPLATELLFGLTMAVRDYITAKELHFLFGLLTMFLLAMMLNGNRDRGVGTGQTAQVSWPQSRWLPVLGVGLFLANPVVQYEIRVAYVDLALAFFFLSGFVFLERLLSLPKERSLAERRSALIVVGICCGMVCAVKLSGVLAATSLLLVYGLSRARQSNLRVAFKEAAWVLPGILALALPWPAKAWWLTGNPIYPLLFDVFGGPDWSEALGARHDAWQASIGMGRTLLDYALLPWRVITLGGQGYDHFDGELHLGWLAVLPAVLWVSVKDGPVRRALLVSGLVFISWAVTSQQIRLLIPVAALLAFAGARALGAIAGSWRGESTHLLNAAGRSLVPLLAIAMLASTVVTSWSYFQQTPRLASDLARLGESAKPAVIHPVYRRTGELPAQSRLLLLNTNHGFFVERPYMADSFFEASQVIHLFEGATTTEDVRHILAQREVTHVLYEVRTPGMPYPEPLLRLLQDPRFVRLDFRSPDERFAILELAPPGGSF